jgi:hypothetical protein
MTVRNFPLLTLNERIFLNEFQLFAFHRNESPFRRDGNEKNVLLRERERERERETVLLALSQNSTQLSSASDVLEI